MIICHLTSIHKRTDIRVFQKECVSLANKTNYKVYLVVNDNLPDETLNNVFIKSTNVEMRNRLHRFMNRNKQLYKKALSINADLYHLHDPDLINVGVKLKKLGYKVIFDSHENIPDQIMEKNWIPKYLRWIISKLYGLYEKKKLTKLDYLITVSPHIKNRLKKINMNVSIITNYPIIKYKSRISHDNDEFRICFAGGIDHTWNHDLIIDSISKLSNVKYIIAGPSDSKYIEKLRKIPGWNKVEYLGFISKEEVENLYLSSDLGVALHHSKQVEITGTLGNNKLFEFLESGLPVLCTDYLIWKDIVEKYNCGYTINPLSRTQFIETIEMMIKNRDQLVKLGENGRKAIENEFNWKSQERKLLDIYKRILGD